MLITHFNYKSYKVKTLVHVGANVGEELDFYKSIGINRIYFFEPRPDAIQELYENCKYFRRDIDITILPFGLGSDNDEKFLYEGSQSSSFLLPKTHLDLYPDIKFNHNTQTSFSVRRGDAVLPKNLNIDILVLDTQGYELEVLKGMGNLLNTTKIICTEFFTEELYEGCPTIDHMDSFLYAHRFKRAEAVIVPQKWGDALYVKQ